MAANRARLPLTDCLPRLKEPGLPTGPSLRLAHQQRRFAGVWPLLSQTASLEPEVRVECWVRTSVPAHPEGYCCGVYKGTTSPHTPQGMLLWGLQRYYLSPHTPRDAAVGFTKVLSLPTHPVHPKGCCCRVYKGTTSPHTPQGMLLWGLQRYYLSPHTPRDAAVGFTKALPLPTPLPPPPEHPKGCCCVVYKGTSSPHTPRTPQRDPARVCLVSLTSFRSRARDHLVSAKFFVVLWHNDSQSNRAGPQLLCITIHLQHIIVFML